jgi:hypothetical protein
MREIQDSAHAARWRTAVAALTWMALAMALPPSALAKGAGQVKPIGTVTLDSYRASTKANSGPASIHARLARGKLFVATVQGTISYYAAINYVAVQAPWATICGKTTRAPIFPSAGGSGQTSNDAEFILAEPSQTATCAVTLPAHWFNFQIDSGAGWSHPTALSLATLTAPTPTHTYQYPVIGHGQGVSFRLIDPDVRDDYGSLRISVRPAVASDCAGTKYKAFTFASHRACVAAVGKGTAPRERPVTSTVTIEQEPLTRVLRVSDVPGALNLEPPAGALTASQLASADTAGATIAREEAGLLQKDGYRSGAITEFGGVGRALLRSTAIKLGSPVQAEGALAGIVALAARAQAPAGAHSSTAANGSFAHAQLITYTPTAAGGEGGVQLIVAEGDYVYGLLALQTPDSVSQASVEQLVHTVIARP